MKTYLPFLCIAIGFFPFFTHAQTYDIVVAKDGSGDVKTVQEAFDRVPDKLPTKTTIFIRNGIYKEKLHLLATKLNVVLLGESKEKTILTYDDYGSKTGVGGTDNSYSTLIEGNDFYASEITFQNTIDS